MIVFRALTRLLLCCCLVLNGSGAALAGDFSMHAAKPQHQGVMPAAHAMEDCDGMMGGNAAAEPDAVTSLLKHGAGEHSHGTGCCDAGNACDCSCQQHSPATLAVTPMLAAISACDAVSGSSEVAPASVRPPRLIRPPIA